MNSKDLSTMPVPPAILKLVVCCSCQKSFYGRRPQEQRSKNPYLLSCGHSTCESCCQNLTTNVISCGTCGALTQLSSVIRPTSNLPKNAYLLGRINLENKQSAVENISYIISPKLGKIPQNNIDVDYLENSFGSCYECTKTDATMACQQCDCNFCDSCWTKVHSSGKSLRKHVPMTNNSFNLKNVEKCEIHEGKDLEFFCRQCNIYACPNCVVLKHQGEGHTPVTLQERNFELFKEVDQLKKEVDLNMKRMWDAAKEAKALKKVPCRDQYEDLQRQVVQNFVHLHGVLQITEESILKRLESAKNARRDRLDEILLQLDRQIEATQVVMRKLENLKEPKQLQADVSLERILDTLTNLKNLPSRLVCSKDQVNVVDTPIDKPAVSFDETIIQSLKNCCKLNIPKGDVLELKSDDSVVFDCSDQLSPEDVGVQPVTLREEDVMSVKSKNSECSDESKNGAFRTYTIRTTRHPLSVLSMPKTRPFVMMEGKAYPVCISYVKDPGEFYVVRSSLRKQRQKIDALALTMANRAQSLPELVQKDEYYLVQYATDKKWYRGRVIDVLPGRDRNNETVAVIYYLDYGNKQEVPLSRLREMPKVLRDESPLAIKCKLYSCLPRNGTWCTGSTKIMLDVLDKSVMTMYVMKELPDCLEVDLSRRGTDESLDHEIISLCNLLVFLGYASFTGGNDKMKYRKYDPKYLTSVLPNAEDTFHGFITYVESESLFYIQKVGPETRYWQALMERLDSTYKKEKVKGLIYNPDIDMPCAAMYPQDGKWYRGEITDFPGQEQLTVYYVDYGNKEIVHWKEVRKLHPEFLKLVPQAIPCSLANVPHRDSGKERLERYLYEILRVFVVRKDKRKLSVLLYTSKNACVNDELVNDVTQDGSEPSPRMDEPVETKKSRGRRKGRKKEVSHREASSKEPNEVFRTKVKVLRAESPSDIYVSLLCFSSRAEELEKELQDFYATSETGSRDKWEVNDRCAVLSCRRETWHRATVSEILGNDMMRVFLMDVAETEDVPVSNVRTLNERFFAFPTGAVKCHLSGIFPPETEWPGLTSEFLQSKLDKYKDVYMTKMGEIVNNSFPVQLWVKKRRQGGALEPSTEEWIVLNDLIVEQGLAVPEKAKLVHHIVTEETIPVDEDDKTTRDFKECCPSDETEDCFIPSVACDWLPPELCLKDRFVGEPTYVDSDGVIYIQYLEDKPILDQMRTSLRERYENTKPKPHDQYWSTGQLCIVRYHLDGGWYRGKVLQINEDCTYKILFVDYGNVETCRITEMRKDVSHMDIPILTRRFALHGVIPVSEDKLWPSLVIDYIYSSVVEKRCDVSVVEKVADPSEPIKIRLKVQEDGFDMCEDLVRLGLAELVSDKKHEIKKRKNDRAVPQVPVTVTYSELQLPDDFKTFPVEVLIMKYMEFFAHISDHESIPAEVRTVIADFVSLVDEIQSAAEGQEKLEDFSEGVPCISLYSNNGTWYRAEVLRVDTDTDLVLVRYVDYGNEELVTKDRIRKCSSKWFNVPAMAFNLKLHNVRMSDGVKKSDYMESLKKCLSQPGLIAEIVQKRGNYYVVDVKQSGVLAYQRMVDDGLMEFVEKPEIVTKNELIDNS